MKRQSTLYRATHKKKSAKTKLARSPPDDFWITHVFRAHDDSDSKPSYFDKKKRLFLPFFPVFFRFSKTKKANFFCVLSKISKQKRQQQDYKLSTPFVCFLIIFQNHNFYFYFHHMLCVHNSKSNNEVFDVLQLVDSYITFQLHYKTYINKIYKVKNSLKT